MHLIFDYNFWLSLNFLSKFIQTFRIAISLKHLFKATNYFVILLSAFPVIIVFQLILPLIPSQLFKILRETLYNNCMDLPNVSFYFLIK